MSPAQTALREHDGTFEHRWPLSSELSTRYPLRNGQRAAVVSRFVAGTFILKHDFSTNHLANELDVRLDRAGTYSNRQNTTFC